MDRRGFLKSLTAAAAGMAAAARSGSLVTAAAVGEARPRLSKEQEYLIGLLRNAVLVSWSCNRQLNGPGTYSAAYHTGDGACGLEAFCKTLPFCDYTHGQVLEIGIPLSIELRGECSAKFRPVANVNVEWLLP
jgi:hypothetical protein